MKIFVTLKTPDALYNAVKEAVESTMLPDGGPDAAFDKENAIDEAMDIAKTWFRYNEYITVVIDTEAKTCTVTKV